jgi:hypothetical protein
MNVVTTVCNRHYTHDGRLPACSVRVYEICVCVCERDV